MVNATHTSLVVEDRSSLAGIKKEINRLVTQAGFGQQRIHEIDILVAEMGSNLVKHSLTGGEILAGIVKDKADTELELISIDNGPGIADPERMMQDGISTAGTLGHGLGAIRRLSDQFELYSHKDWGTILLSRVYREKTSEHAPQKLPVAVRSLVIVKPGEQVSGDGSYSFVARDGSFRLLAADGLGHGAEADRAVREAVQAFKELESDSPVEILRRLHTAIQRTRGMVGTVVVGDPVRKLWRYCGIGNIAARFAGVHLARNYLSYNGIIGHNIPVSLSDQELSQNDYQQITLCSDGIRSRWQYAKLPDTHRQDLMIQAAAIYKDFSRKTDDMSITIGKLSA